MHLLIEAYEEITTYKRLRFPAGFKISSARQSVQTGSGTQMDTGGAYCRNTAAEALSWPLTSGPTLRIRAAIPPFPPCLHGVHVANFTVLQLLLVLQLLPPPLLLNDLTECHVSTVTAYGMGGWSSVRSCGRCDCW